MGPAAPPELPSAVSLTKYALTWPIILVDIHILVGLHTDAELASAP